MITYLRTLSRSSALLLGASIMLVLFFGGWFLLDAFRIHQGGGFPPPGIGRNHPVSERDVEHTRAWMTFDLINERFALPPEYLREGLSITDVRYPRISIAEAAESRGITVDSFLESVKIMLRAKLPLTP